MLPSNNSKFNKKKGKTKNFPIKQFRFDVTNSPIIKSKSKCSFKIKSILSQQEELMLKGLSNSFQVSISESFRIALSKVSTIASDEFESFLPLSLAQSTHKAHQGRSRKFEIRIPKEEKETLKLIARTHDITEQAAVRLVIIYTEKSIRAGTLKDFDGCRMLSDGETWDNWSKDKPVSSGKLDALKKARDKAYDEATKRGQEYDKLVYERRGETITELAQGGVTNIYLEHGRLDIQAIDAFIAIDEEEKEEDAWNLYMQEIQMKEDISDYERRIEREIWKMDRLDIQINRDEAIEIIKDEDESNRDFTEEEWEEYENFQKESNELARKGKLMLIAEKLGISVDELPKEEQERLLQESEVREKEERDLEHQKREDKKYAKLARRFSLHLKEGQTNEQAVKEHLDKVKRIDEQGLTEEEKQYIYDKVEKQSREWEEYKKRVGYGETHD